MASLAAARAATGTLEFTRVVSRSSIALSSLRRRMYAMAAQPAVAFAASCRRTEFHERPIAEHFVGPSRLSERQTFCSSAQAISTPEGTKASSIPSPTAAASSTASAPATTPATATDSESEVFPSDLPKAFDFAAEERIYQWWESSGFFLPDASMALPREGEEDKGHARNTEEQQPFVVSMPPPNVTGALHMGHAMFVTLEDLMIRFWRMNGRPTLWLPGTDHAGIATQLVVEKMLTREGQSRQQLGREEFIRRVWDWKEEYGGTIARQIQRLGASCDWSRERFTLDPQLSRAVIEAFTRLHNKGLVYRGTYMVNWSPFLQTAVSDLEVEYSEEPGTLFFFKYPVAGSNGDEYLPVATTRPETIFGDTAVAVHPEDERYRHLVGREAEVPLSGGRRIPIIADDYVDREFGTGALKITPGHDINDYAIGQRRELPIINIMRADASMNEAAGAFCGMDRFVARKAVWEQLKEQGLTIREEAHVQRVPRSQRGGEVVEPLVSRQWFVRMQPLAEPALAAVKEGRLKIVPQRFEKIYSFWLEGIKDWCISRQLWWGHRIPVFYVTLPQGRGQAGKGMVEGETRGLWGQAGGEGEGEEYVVAATEEEARERVRERYGEEAAAAAVLQQDNDVLDTWFSSGLWPFSTLGWPDEQADDFKRFYPTAVMETGHDILFFWVARMVMMGIEFTGELPFSTIYLHGLVRDGEGRKMSKSLGNVIDPLDSIADFGTDALRFTLATGTTPGQDVNLSMERLTANRAFTNKIWNAGKFILQNLPDSDTDEQAWRRLGAVQFSSPQSLESLPLAERWLLSRLHGLIDDCSKGYRALEFNAVGRQIYDFLWSDFADWYVEISKTRLYPSFNASSSPSVSTVAISNSSSSNDAATASKHTAQAVLVYTFDSILRLLHPFMPFVTEQLWQALPHSPSSPPSLMLAAWPSTSLPRDTQAEELFADLQALVRSIRNVRAEYAVEPARRIAATVVVGQGKRAALESEQQSLCLLARIDGSALHFADNNSGTSLPSSLSSSSCVHVVAAEGVEAYLPLSGMVDLSKEMKRLEKQAGKLKQEAQALRARLASPKFVEKAPADVVGKVREQAEEAEEKLAMVQVRLDSLTAN